MLNIDHAFFSSATAAETRTARLALLEKEKAFIRLKDTLAKERQELPWTPVGTAYAFASEHGNVGGEKVVDEGTIPGFDLAALEADVAARAVAIRARNDAE